MAVPLIVTFDVLYTLLEKNKVTFLFNPQYAVISIHVFDSCNGCF